ncbi:hypothetical protein LPW11_11330 [Geomonas sp. RF6]|uniref:hypothetical protein n=1 Tax=Geomonas sp. RF6 TaxID=2897342 RepID=UPI001E57AA35|nr:hypothetical protein [Geomonas sp. RF6]UFS72760.1 hypothetical protein LPW11_11330 [Geomonas sp. RF6]
MKKVAVALFAVVLAHSAAAHAGMNVSVGFYAPPPVVVAPPPAVVYEAPPPPPVPRAAPRFVYSPDLGFYVSDNPYDIAYIGQSYYLYRGGYWYAAPTCNGPWMAARGRALPPELRRFSYREISYYRDRECHHRDDRREYRGRWYGDHERWEHRRDRW